MLWYPHTGSWPVRHWSTLPTLLSGTEHSDAYHEIHSSTPTNHLRSGTQTLFFDASVLLTANTVTS